MNAPIIRMVYWKHNSHLFGTDHSELDRWYTLLQMCQCFTHSITFIWIIFLRVSHCFREKGIVTCKIVNVIVFIFGNKISKRRSFEKLRAIFTYFSHFLIIRETTYTLTHTHTHTHTPPTHTHKSFSTYLTFILYTNIRLPNWLFGFPILHKLRIHHVRFLFGATPGVDSYSRHFGAINELQNGEQDLSWNICYWYLFTLMQNL